MTVVIIVNQHAPSVGHLSPSRTGMLRYGPFTPYWRVALRSIGAWPRRLGAQALCDWLIAICALRDLLIHTPYAELFTYILVCIMCLQCYDAVGWAAGRASGL